MERKWKERYKQKFRRRAVARMNACENITRLSRELGVSRGQTDNIGFTIMTYFPLQFPGLALTSIRQSASPVRSSPPLEIAIAPPL